MPESWAMLMLVWCPYKWMLTALTDYQQPISYYFKARVWARQAEGLCSRVWFRRSTQTAQSQLPGLARIWAKVAKMSTNIREKEKQREREREREDRRESERSECEGKYQGEKPWRPFQYFPPIYLPRLSSPAPLQMPAGTEQTSTEQFYLNNSFLLYIY